MSGWQPIETAPRDGTNVLLAWWVYKRPFIGTWNAPANSFLEFNAMGYEPCNPSHWQPLPELPSKEAMKGGD